MTTLICGKKKVVVVVVVVVVVDGLTRGQHPPTHTRRRAPHTCTHMHSHAKRREENIEFEEKKGFSFLSQFEEEAEEGAEDEVPEPLMQCRLWRRAL